MIFTFTQPSSKGNNIGDEGCFYICESLISNTTLTELYLEGEIYFILWFELQLDNNIGSEGAFHISEILKSNNLKKLYLTSKIIFFSPTDFIFRK